MSDCSQLLFNKKETAAMLGLSVRSVEYLLASRELDYRKIGRKTLIPKATLVRFAAGDHPIEKRRTEEEAKL